MKGWKVGDRVWRYAFNAKNEKIQLDTFELVDLVDKKVAAYPLARFTCMNDHRKTLCAGTVVRLDNDFLGRVRTRGQTKYVLVRSGKLDEAVEILRGYLKKQMDAHETALNNLNRLWEWVDDRV